MGENGVKWPRKDHRMPIEKTMEAMRHSVLSRLARRERGKGNIYVII